MSDVNDRVRQGGQAGLDAAMAMNGTPPPRPAKQRRQANDVLPPETNPKPCTDLGNAERLARRHGADLRYCHEWEKWLHWDGERWRLDDSGEISRRTAETMRAILTEARDAADQKEAARIAAWAIASESAGRIDAAMRLCRSIKGIPILHKELDRDPWLLNVKNGTIDLRTGELREHRREDLITKIAPVRFDPAAKCPLWLALLDTAMKGRKELIDFLHRAIGYALTGSVREQALIFLWGGGSNGKSTIMELLLALLGDYAIAGAGDLLVEKHNESHPTELADLFGARLVVCQEVGAGRKWNEALIKRLTGSDTIKARRMKEDFWHFLPTHKIFISANHKPTVRGTDHAIWRRIKLVPFEVKIVKPNRQLPEELIKEMPGILAWAVRGCLAWQKYELSAPEAVTEATEAYRHEQDHLGHFLRDRCVLGTAERTTRKALRESYEAWCKESGEAPVPPRTLADMLREHNISDSKVRHPVTLLPVDGWKGVRLLSDIELRDRADKFEREQAGEPNVVSSDL